MCYRPLFDALSSVTVIRFMTQRNRSNAEIQLLY